jgi:hypothetical protein
MATWLASALWVTPDGKLSAEARRFLRDMGADVGTESIEVFGSGAAEAFAQQGQAIEAFPVAVMGGESPFYQPFAVERPQQEHIEVFPIVIPTTTPTAASIYPNGIGYTAASSVSVTQLTDKSTTVNANGLHGSITMNAAALNANTTVAFTLTNSSIEAGDIVLTQIEVGGTSEAYTTWAEETATGSVTVLVRNVTGGNLSEAVNLSFFLLKRNLT